MSVVGKAFQTLYRAGRVTKDGMKRAVADGVLSAAEYEEITGEPYSAD